MNKIRVYWITTIANLDIGTKTDRQDNRNRIRRGNENLEVVGKRNDDLPLDTSAKLPSQLLQEGFAGNNIHQNEDYIPPLLSGERVEGVYKDMTYLCPYSLPCAVKGSMVLTNYRIYFKSDVYDISASSSGSPLQSPPLVLDVPLGFVSNIVKIGGQNRPGDEHAYGIEVVCKDIRTLKFAMSKKFQDGVGFNSHSINTKGPSSRGDMYQQMRRFCFPNSNGIPMFAYEFNEEYPPKDSNGRKCVNGWKIYDPNQVGKIYSTPLVIIKSVKSIKLAYLQNDKKFRNSKDKEFRMKAGE